MARTTATRRPAERREPATVAAHNGSVQHPIDDLVTYVENYARRKPAEVALWCLGVGFILGWKLKPW